MALTAIFGGTFNPFHIGHYEMLAALQIEEEIEKIFVMPDKIPPHKVCDFLADDNIRIEMCRIACDDFSKAELCLIEFEREGKSYSYDTVIDLKQRYKDKNFVFVCGGDMLVTFDRWYKYEELMKQVPFIAFRRSDIDNSLFDSCVKKLSDKGMRITVMEEIISAVSSTEIRNDWCRAKEYLPQKVFEFLNERGVYNG